MCSSPARAQTRSLVRELTPQTFAARIGRSVRTVRYWCQTRQIRCRITTGPCGQKRYWIPVSELGRSLAEK